MNQNLLKKRAYSFILALFLLSFAVVTVKAQTGPDPFATYLKAIPQPVFNPTNQLKPLTWCGWNQQYSNTCVQLGLHWNYAVSLGGSDPTTAGTMANGLGLIAKANTNFLVVGVVLQKPILTYFYPPYNTNNPVTGTFYGKGYYCTNAAGQYLKADGTITTNAAEALESPCAPDSEIQHFTDAMIHNWQVINSNAPLSVFENDGEWGIQEYDGNYHAYWQDPRFTNAMAALGVTNTEPDLNQDPKIYSYMSQQKSRECANLAAAIRTSFPNAFYFYYNTSIEKFRRVTPTDFIVTNSIDGMNTRFGFDSGNIATNFDYPTSEVYYHNSNSGFSLTNALAGSPPGITPDIFSQSLLMQQVNWKSWNISQGKQLSYDYLTSGWTSQGVGTNATGGTGIYPDNQYIGFLKVCYTLGTIGGNMGWYGNSGSTDSSSQGLVNYNALFSTNNVPVWMSQLILLSRVQAQFSWLQDYLYHGNLVPGPYTNGMNFDLNNYDFAPEGTMSSVNLPNNSVWTNNAHVFVRQRTDGDTNRWLLTAWTTYTQNESVTVTVPTLGSVTLNARTNGAVYLATPTTLTLQDTNGLYPTEWRASKPLPPPNLRLDK